MPSIAPATAYETRSAEGWPTRRAMARPRGVRHQSGGRVEGGVAGVEDRDQARTLVGGAGPVVAQELVGPGAGVLPHPVAHRLDGGVVAQEDVERVQQPAGHQPDQVLDELLPLLL